MSHLKKILISVLLSIVIFFTSFPLFPVSADLISFVILSQNKATLNIGEGLYILAITSNGKKASWKSSDSKIASVNTYGVITAKRYGSAVITAKITDAEASCFITVNKTEVTISNTSITVERGQSCKLSATTSNGSKVKWKSSKKSIASVDEYGTVSALKPGVTAITATADGTSTACTFTVKSPTVTLDKSSIRLFRSQAVKLSALVSSKIPPVWKSNRKSVAVVDSYGNITAIKHGTATITATVDKISATCEINVMQPEITLSSDEITLAKGVSTTLTAKVSSGINPTWTSSNTTVATVDCYGKVTAKGKGNAYIYAAEDGTKARCIVHVTE